ncbi:hypothetical protein Y032_0479g2226 [Ancylostoma ceylanicum]|nr:hypothetical protein Y032_0479g2226 [Ancylostoma ceylanicum]
MLDDTMYEIFELRNSARSKKKKEYKYASSPKAVPDEPPAEVIQAGRFSTESVEQPEEDFSPPNAENFMPNITDIEYTTHDMIRTMGNTNDFPLPVAIEKRQPNFHMGCDLKLLEKQPHFGWQSLQANTFLSNVLCLPTEQEKERLLTAVDHTYKNEKAITILPTQTVQAYKASRDAGESRKGVMSARLKPDK